MTFIVNASFQTCDNFNAAQPVGALELVSAVASLWLVGLALAALLGRAAAYLARTRQLVQSPFRTTLRYASSVVYWAMAAIRRLIRVIVAWLWQRLWNW